ncbi:DsbA family protein [Streptomyces sp. NBC_01511]|uniref:DsbA family oxidoreductase n=1 Tax=Streptomyces sp. NBC_01511 TaxID=2903889 RepID=UPI003866D1AC
MRIEIWADVVCAWAFIGKRRLEKALAGPAGTGAEVVWRPFRIDPTRPTRRFPSRKPGATRWSTPPSGTARRA